MFRFLINRPAGNYLLLALLISTQNVFAQSWVEVREEPRHHLVFENQYVRLLNVFLGPGDTTLYHRHNTPSVFIELSNTRTGAQLLGANPVVTSGIFSRTVNFDSINRQRIHRVWNADSVWMHVIDAELPGRRPVRPIPLVRLPGLEKLFVEEKVNGYQCELLPGKTLILPPNGSPYLIVTITQGDVKFGPTGKPSSYRVQPGHFFWIDAGEKKPLVNTGSARLGLTILQF